VAFEHAGTEPKIAGWTPDRYALLALDGEHGIDALDRLSGDRRLAQPRQVKELAPPVCPARSFNDRSGFAVGLVELGEAGAAWGLPVRARSDGNPRIVAFAAASRLPALFPENSVSWGSIRPTLLSPESKALKKQE
jgi:hypothetical protein